MSDDLSGKKVVADTLEHAELGCVLFGLTLDHAMENRFAPPGYAYLVDLDQLSAPITGPWKWDFPRREPSWQRRPHPNPFLNVTP